MQPIVAGGRPSKGTPKDQRLKRNKKAAFPGAKPPFQKKGGKA